MTNKNTLKDIFLNELANIDANISRYDTHSLIIKGWAITLWAGLVYFAIRETVYILFVIQIIALLLFWSFDALYKFYQRRFTIRSEEILYFLRDYIIEEAGNGLEFKNKNMDDSKSKNIEKKNTNDSNNKDIGNKKNKILPLVIQREKSPIDLDDKNLKSLKRCITLRAVSTIYLFLIASSFLISLFITSPKCVFLRWWIFGFGLGIVFFTFFNYAFGYDNAINKGYINKYKKDYVIFKWFFNLFRWSTFIIIFLGIIFLLIEFSPIPTPS